MTFGEMRNYEAFKGANTGNILVKVPNGAVIVDLGPDNRTGTIGKLVQIPAAKSVVLATVLATVSTRNDVDY